MERRRVRLFTGVQDFVDAVGHSLGSSDWLTIDQRRIDTFAEATGDRQWIHVDRDRAAAGPFRKTIAHGYLTLSLFPYLLSSIYRVDGAAMAVNYGLNRVRFVSPVPVGSRVRATSSLKNAERSDRAVQVTFENTIELDGAAKAACVAETISRFHF